MSRDELKEEVPEEVLEDILDYLKILVTNPKEKLGMATRLRQIIIEDQELLQKLAK